MTSSTASINQINSPHSRGTDAHTVTQYYYKSESGIKPLSFIDAVSVLKNYVAKK